jgi:hypothetical protein
LAQLVSFLSGGSQSDEHAEHHDEKNKNEGKFDSFGYSTRIILGSVGHTNSRTRELASSLNIFSNPDGVKFLVKRPQKTIYSKTLRAYSKYRSLLSVTELAGIIHLPTIYVKTP